MNLVVLAAIQNEEYAFLIQHKDELMGEYQQEYMAHSSPDVFRMFWLNADWFNGIRPRYILKEQFFKSCRDGDTVLVALENCAVEANTTNDILSLPIVHFMSVFRNDVVKALVDCVKVKASLRWDVFFESAIKLWSYELYNIFLPVAMDNPMIVVNFTNHLEQACKKKFYKDADTKLFSLILTNALTYVDFTLQEDAFFNCFRALLDSPKKVNIFKTFYAYLKPQVHFHSAKLLEITKEIDFSHNIGAAYVLTEIGLFTIDDFSKLCEASLSKTNLGPGVVRNRLDIIYTNKTHWRYETFMKLLKTERYDDIDYMIDRFTVPEPNIDLFVLCIFLCISLGNWLLAKKLHDKVETHPELIGFFNKAGPRQEILAGPNYYTQFLKRYITSN